MPSPDPRGRCGAYRCACPGVYAPRKTRDYDICGCGHSTLSHAPAPSARKEAA